MKNSTIYKLMWGAFGLSIFFYLLGVYSQNDNPLFFIFDIIKCPVFLLCACWIYFFFSTNFEFQGKLKKDFITLRILFIPLWIEWVKSLPLSYWWDSSQTIWRAKNLAEGLEERFSFFYIFLHYLFGVFGGETPILSNLVPIFFTLVTWFFLFKLVELLAGSEQAKLSLFFIVPLPALFLLSQWVNLDMPLAAGYTCSLYLWVTFLKKGKRFSLFLFLLTTIFTTLIKEYGILIFPMALLSWVVLTPSVRTRKILIICGGILGVGAFVLCWIGQNKLIPGMLNRNGISIFIFQNSEELVSSWWIQMWKLFEMELHFLLLTSLLFPAFLAFLKKGRKENLFWYFFLLLLFHLITLRINPGILPDYSLFMPFDQHLALWVTLIPIVFITAWAWKQKWIEFDFSKSAMVFLSWLGVILFAFMVVGRLHEGQALLDWRYTAMGLPPLAALASMGFYQFWKNGTQKEKLVLATWMALILFSNLTLSVTYSNYFQNYRKNITSAYQIAKSKKPEKVYTTWPFYHHTDLDLGHLKWNSDKIEVKNIYNLEKRNVGDLSLLMNDVPKEVGEKLPFYNLLWGEKNQARMLSLVSRKSPLKIGDDVLLLEDTYETLNLDKQKFSLPLEFFPFKIIPEKSSVVCKNGKVRIRAKVRNLGKRIWPAMQPYHVCLGFHLKNSTGSKTIQHDMGKRIPLPYRLLPGEEINLDSLLDIDLQKGEYLLEMNLVIDGVTWFDKYYPQGKSSVVLRVL